MITETKICTNGQWKTGYFLTIKQITNLCRDFMLTKDYHEGFISNDEVYIESQLEKMGD